MVYSRLFLYFLVEIVLVCLCSLIHPISPVLTVESLSSPNQVDDLSLETWIQSSVNITLTTTKNNSSDFQQAEDRVQITGLYNYTRLIFYVLMNRAPMNLSITVMIGSWVRNVFLTPTNCSFRGWVDVNFNIPWDYPGDTILDMPLLVQACLKAQNFEVQGWIGRIMLRSFGLTSLIGKPKEIPLSPQNQSQTFGSVYSWYPFMAQTEGLISFPHSTNGMGISLNIEVQWTGIESLASPSTLKANLAGHNWEKQINTNGSALMKVEEEILDQSLQREQIIVFLQMDMIRGDYINVYFHVFIQVWELLPSPSSASRQVSPLESIISPTFLVSAIVVIGGLIAGRSYHYRKWHKKKENIEQIVMKQLN